MQTLDPATKQKVTYCIPHWLRDEQIKLAVARPLPRIQGGTKELRSDPIAVVCFGPSLRDTWQQLATFKYIISCSGAHKFLVERGIIPTWHVEVDPRPHKVELLGPPHPDVEYLIASTCHPSYFDHLSGFNVKLWHVFDTAEEGLRMLPRGEWAITGGCSVGLRCLTLARFFGFTDLHVFGMDGSAKESSHAAPHPNGPSKFQPCEYGGITYQTTPSMLEAARQTWHELNQMHDVRTTFYGDGLVQAMAKDYKPEPNKGVAIALNKPELISVEYAALNARLHKENLAYGVGGGKHADTVLKIASNPSVRSILDYGCGKGYLGKALAEKGIPIWEYDPAVPGKEESPRPADLVVCTDVLEHIEPDRLIYVLDDLKRCVKQIGYFVVNTGPAQKTLADGRNTHLIQKPEEWWRKRLGKFFKIAKIMQAGADLHIVVQRRVNAKASANSRGAETPQNPQAVPEAAHAEGGLAWPS